MSALSPVLALGLGSTPGPKLKPHAIFLAAQEASGRDFDRVLDPVYNHTTSEGRLATGIALQILWGTGFLLTE
jgi:hypothetical protein